MVEQRCQQLFNNWLGDIGIECEVEPGLREVVMNVAISSCPQHQTLDSLLKLLDVPQERSGFIILLDIPETKTFLSPKILRPGGL